MNELKPGTPPPFKQLSPGTPSPLAPPAKEGSKSLLELASGAGAGVTWWGAHGVLEQRDGCLECVGTSRIWPCHTQPHHEASSANLHSGLSLPDTQGSSQGDQ